MNWECFYHPLVAPPKYAIRGQFGILVNEIVKKRIVSAVAKNEADIPWAIQKVDDLKERM